MAGLAELRKLREQGKTRSSLLHYEEDDGEIYDELDDATYLQRQREELRRDDFVVDDDGEGYVDNGQDVWDTRHSVNNDDVYEELPRDEKRRKLVKPRAKGKEAAPQVKGTAGDISVLFRKAQQTSNSQRQSTPSGSGPTIHAKRGPAQPIEDIISGLGSRQKMRSLESSASSSLGSLGSIGSVGLGSRRGLSSTWGSSLSGIRGSNNTNRIDSTATPTPARPHLRSSNAPIPHFELPPNDVSQSSMLPESVPHSVDSSQVDATNISVDSNVDVSQSVGMNSPVPSSPPPALVEQIVELEEHPAYQTPTPVASEDDAWRTSEYAAHTNIVTTMYEDIEMDDKDELNASSDEMLQFWWTDYKETPSSQAITLFGRTKSEKSVLVTVRDLDRELYFLPRDGQTPEDVKEELLSGALRGIRFRNAVQRKKYCFGLDGVPQEADYLKVLLSFSVRVECTPGKTYSHVFGTQTPLFEAFVLQKDIWGPCWLEVNSFKPMERAGTTHVQVEVPAPKFIRVAADQDVEPPQLTALGLSVRTKFVSGRHEIVAVSLRAFQHFKIDTVDSATQLPQAVFTAVRPVEGVWPAGFKQLAEQQNSKAKNSLVLHQHEKGLLSWVMAKLQGLDPDVLIGHSLQQVHLEILLQRMLDLDVQQWSNLGRLRVRSPPSKSAQHLGVLHTTAGRLVCDLGNTMGHELTSTKCSEFTLDEMVRTYLGGHRAPHDVNINRSAPWDPQHADGLMQMLRHNELDTLYSVDLVVRLQMLPLTKQLTTLAGNAWARTLAGTRSGRNDFLLLHEFTKAGYIVPDRVSNTAALEEKGAKYQGGAVFEPEKGLYRSNVLVMDFNSLYPSLIQEYNICFSTIDLAAFKKTQPEDGSASLPSIPSRDISQGILPRVIQALVERRRSVKSLMKDKNATARQLADYDIRQTALKLTANSMYGCLGLTNSRFAAQPLAMLVTAKGRETLYRTRELAESQNLRVLYGDTDSLMIYTGISDMAETRRIGMSFKKLVNDQYRRMELDIDNVFSAILLYAKKKYAAIENEELQVKGLDLKRREYCQLCKDVSLQLLRLMFEGAGTKNDDGDDDDDDSTVFHDRVLPYLRQVRQDMMDGKTALGKYILRNQLSRDPNSYKDQRLPQLTVAQARLKAGDIVHAKDVISYIISSGSGAPFERAVSVSDLRKRSLQPDIAWYLDHQLYAPAERLLQYVPGFDPVQLGEALGLEKKPQHRHSGGSGGKDGAGVAEYYGIQPLETSIPDAERFVACQVLCIKGSCNHEFAFTGISDPQFTSRGIVCPECSRKLSWPMIAAQVDAAARASIQRYYAGWLKCTDPECEIQTRQFGVGGRRCPRPRCTGKLTWKYSDKELYTQLSYFAALFDPTRAKDTKAKALAHENEAGLAHVSQSIQKYLDLCGRRYVDLKGIFGRVAEAMLRA